MTPTDRDRDATGAGDATTELAPCPHCGCADVRTPTVNYNGRPIPRCTGCDAEAPSPEAWNRLAPAPAGSAEVECERLRAEVELLRRQFRYMKEAALSFAAEEEPDSPEAAVARRVQAAGEIERLRAWVANQQRTLGDLANGLAAVRAERDAEKARADRMAEPLLEALQRAAAELPQGYVVRVGVERFAGWVSLDTPDDIDVPEADPHESFAVQVHHYINQAAARAGETGGES